MSFKTLLDACSSCDKDKIYEIMHKKLVGYFTADMMEQCLVAVGKFNNFDIFDKLLFQSCLDLYNTFSSNKNKGWLCDHWYFSGGCSPSCIVHRRYGFAARIAFKSGIRSLLDYALSNNFVIDVNVFTEITHGLACIHDNMLPVIFEHKIKGTTYTKRETVVLLNYGYILDNKFISSIMRARQLKQDTVRSVIYNMRIHNWDDKNLTALVCDYISYEE
jgi:hypothetical protein